MQIDGVFSGGGIKGVALAGAYEALEERAFALKGSPEQAPARLLPHLSLRAIRAERFIPS